MRSLKAILSISAIVFFVTATNGQGANWVYYGEAENGSYRSYYDSDSVTDSPNGARVWTKRVFSDRQGTDRKGLRERDIKTDQAEATQTQSLEQIHAQFEKDNPGFRSMWKRGDIQNYMATHPGHSPVSAYREMTFKPRITMMLFELNCKARQITFISQTDYDPTANLRRSIISHKHEQQEAPVIPESMNENLFENVCSTIQTIRSRRGTLQ